MFFKRHLFKEKNKAKQNRAKNSKQNQNLNAKASYILGYADLNGAILCLT